MKFSRRQIFSLLAVAIIAGAIAYIMWGGLEQNMVYFVTPTEVLAKGQAAVGNPVRLGGVVLEGSVKQEGNILNFSVKDDKNSVRVTSSKTPPQMFHEGMGVVVEGSMQADGHFNAERLMVKHGNEYRPPKEGMIPQEIYRSLKKEKGLEGNTK
ncbi:MAG: cytochrome c maturation protein CcmE [Deltaproteobacteria bacterium]|nr:cytochrome c maturation protein CcmE [Deltaproteobacteria bacterium]